jgi:hypothetical protein
MLRDDEMAIIEKYDNSGKHDTLESQVKWNFVISEILIFYFKEKISKIKILHY